jgi:hypothetical protein
MPIPPLLWKIVALYAPNGGAAASEEGWAGRDQVRPVEGPAGCPAHLILKYYRRGSGVDDCLRGENSRAAPCRSLE